MSLSSQEIISSARKCIRIEQDALESTSAKLDDTFVTAVKLIEKTILDGKKLVFTGVGKNVPIGMKLTGTFNSTGVPSTFLDPNQALHGDLGLCQQGDLCILFSFIPRNSTGIPGTDLNGTVGGIPWTGIPDNSGEFPEFQA